MGEMMARKLLRPVMCLAVVIGVLSVGWSLRGQAQPIDPKYELTWFFATMTRGGPFATKSSERTSFGTEADCTAFGKKMTPRMEDWVRGFVRADWNHPVGVRFACSPAGSPI